MYQAQLMRAASKSPHCWPACIGVILCVYALAQTQLTGRLAGTVRDLQGAAIASAKIEAENLANGETRSATCDDSGEFALLFLPPAIYHVTARVGGFEEASFPSVTIALGETTRISVTLGVARATVQVNVNDKPPLVRTDGIELETTITADSLSSLPTPAANVLQLLTTAPGVSAPTRNNNTIG